MKIYDQETQDGLAALIKSNNSLAYTAIAKKSICDGTVANSLWDADRIKSNLAQADANPNQIDLYYLDCILASTGWNGNDDVFGVEETWAAKDTPVDKRFNFMHDDDDIIGHLTSSLILDKQGSVWSDNEPPTDFDIMVGAVLYRSWKDDDQQDRINDLITEIEQGKWFVSMECLFRGFDYAIKDSTGQGQVVARNNDTAFLSKHLRSYGGDGEYQGCKVGRYLKKLVFSGNGLVDNPANPGSIIFNSVNSFNSRAFLVNWEKDDMSDNYQTQAEQLDKDLTAAKAEIAKLREEAQTAAEKKFRDEITSLEAKVAELSKTNDEAQADLIEKDKDIEAVNLKMEEAEAQLKEKDEKLDETEAKIKDMEQENINIARTNDLVQAGLEKEKAEELVQTFAGADEEMFKALVKAHSEKAPEKVEETEESEASEGESEESDEEDEAEGNAEASVEDVEENEDEVIGTVASDDDEKDESRIAVANAIRGFSTLLNKKGE